MGDLRPARSTLMPLVLAWLVHALTASGAVLAFLAFTAIERGSFRLALLWLFVALLVDGIDGPLARAVQVQRRLPRIDGPTLDLVVDYLTYVFVPMVLIVRAGLVPSWFELGAVVLIQASSLYHFARRDSKSVDNYFVGFPALWNLIAFYLLVIRPPPEIAALVVVVFAALSFVPVYFVHPVRVRAFQPWLALLTVPWVGASLVVLWSRWSEPVARGWLGLSLASAAGLLAIGVIRTVRGPALEAAACGPPRRGSQEKADAAE